MSKILINNTASPVPITDTGVTIAASSQYTIPPQDYLLWAASSNVVTYIGDSTLTVNDGSDDLSISDGVDLIKGLFPKTVDAVFNKNSDIVDNKGYLKTTPSLLIFGYHFSQTDHSLWLNTATTGSGTSTLDTAKAAEVMTVTTANNDRVQLETKKVVKYKIGKGHFITISATVGAGKANVTKRWGYYSDTNGWYFSQEGTTNYVVQRSNITGSVVETKIAQANWNLDKLDGTGSSGITWNFENGGVYVVEYTWHGNGLIRFGVQYENSIVYVHQFVQDNAQPYVSIRNPIQPVKCEIVNTGTTASNTSMYIHALSANVYASQEPDSTYRFTASRNISEKSIVDNAYRPLLGIRPKLTFNGRINRILIKPIDYTIYSDSQPVYIRVWLNPTTVTAPSWTSVGTLSAVEYDISATAVSGGTLIYEDYVAAASSLLGGSAGGISSTGINFYSLGLNIDGSTADTLFIEARSLGGGTNCTAVVRWEEYQ